jgi:hypothetical protein
MRKDLLPYFGLPFYRAMLERSGFGDDIARFDEAAGTGDAEAMGQAISEDFLRVLTAVGDGQGVREGVERYREAGATSPCVGPIPRTDFESTLRAPPRGHAGLAARAAIRHCSSRARAGPCPRTRAGWPRSSAPARRPSPSTLTERTSSLASGPAARSEFLSASSQDWSC